MPNKNLYKKFQSLVPSDKVYVTLKGGIKISYAKGQHVTTFTGLMRAVELTAGDSLLLEHDETGKKTYFEVLEVSEQPFAPEQAAFDLGGEEADLQALKDDLEKAETEIDNDDLDGQFEEREAYLQRLAADFDSDEPDNSGDDHDLDTDLMLDDDETFEDEVEETESEKEDRLFLEEFNGKIDYILKFEPVKNHETIRMVYSSMTMRDLDEVILTLNETYGGEEYCKIAASTKDSMDQIRGSGRIKTVLEAFEQKRTDFVKMINSFERIVGADVVFRKVLEPKYHDAAKEALQEIEIVRHVLADILDKHDLQGKKVDRSTVTFSDLLFGLNRVSASFDASNNKIEYLLKDRKKAALDIAHANDHSRFQATRAADLSVVIDQMEADVKRRVIPETKEGCFIADFTGKQFLAERNYVELKTSKLNGTYKGKVTYSTNMLLEELTWVSDKRLALRFNNAEDARLTLEDMIELTMRDKDLSIEDVRIAGQHLKNLHVAVPATYLVGKNDWNLFDK